MSYTQLTQTLRYQICFLNNMGVSQKEIAFRIHVHPSTVCRELARHKDNNGNYNSDYAHKVALEKRKGKSKKRITLEQWQTIVDYIKDELSPEQIHLRLKYLKRFLMADITDPTALARVKKHYDGDPDKPLIIESLLGFGTIISPLTDYTEYNLRVCRPDALIEEDQNKVVSFATEHLGMKYDVRQILDLARFMFPYGILPRSWRSSLFQHNAGQPTNIICSSMIARCFHSVNYPMLPIVKTDRKDQLKFHRRDFRLFVPTDFDYSPYFTILKFPAWPLSMKNSYRNLPWTDEAPEGSFKEKENETENTTVKSAKKIAESIAINATSIFNSLSKKKINPQNLISLTNEPI